MAKRKRDTAQLKAWREVLEQNEAELQLARGKTAEALEALHGCEHLERTLEMVLQRTKARIEELEAPE